MTGNYFSGTHVEIFCQPAIEPRQRREHDVTTSRGLHKHSAVFSFESVQVLGLDWSNVGLHFPIGLCSTSAYRDLAISSR